VFQSDAESSFTAGSYLENPRRASFWCDKWKQNRETDSYQHDAAIVFGEKTDYVIVIFSTAGEYNVINGIQ
ncbi:MAG: hypothetical protein V8Q57_00200, partial [Blautia sp.]